MTKVLIICIVLQLIGVITIMAEFLIPTAGILAILAAGVIGYSLFLVFTEISTKVGMGFVIADLITLPILVVLGFRILANSPLALKKTLSSGDGVTAKMASLDVWVGREGSTHSMLRPTGIVEIDGHRLDAVTRGEFIEKGTPIVVDGVQTNQLVVSAKRNAEPQQL